MPSSDHSMNSNEMLLEDTQRRAAWLSKRIDSSINDARTKRRTNQTRATYVKTATIALSGAATILLGLSIGGLEEYFRQAAFVCGALVTLLNAIEPFFNFRALWVEHERALYRFHRLQDELDFYLVGRESEELNATRLNEFHEQYKQIWADLSETWLEQRRDARTASATGAPQL